MTRSPDEPQFHVFENKSRPGLVYFGIATGTDGFNITAKRAELLAAELRDAARAARQQG